METNPDILLEAARRGDPEAAAELGRMVAEAKYLTTSRDREAREFRISAGPRETDRLRDIAERIGPELAALRRRRPTGR